MAMQTLESAYRTAGPRVHSSFEDARETLQTSSAVIKRERDEIIFGTVISIDGYILTKASELGEIAGLTVTVDRKSYSQPELVAVNPQWDVALLKIDASNLIPVDYSPNENLIQGSWVVANGATSRTQRRVQVGVVSANTREVYSRGGTVLGISIEELAGLVTVESVTPESGAAAAGVLPGDHIISIEDAPILNFDDLLNDLKQRRVGEVVTLRIERETEGVLDLEVTLQGRVGLFGEEKDRNDIMSGEYSERRTGFPRVMQHDIMGNRHYMGGPVLDLNGRCVGMNIARFSRCETYAIPAPELRLLAARMIEDARR